MTEHFKPAASGAAVTVNEGKADLAFVIRLAATASLGGFLFGFDSAVINGAVSGIQKGFHSTSAGTGFAVASILLGAALGALVAGRLADYIGRRLTMILTAIIFAVTAAAAGLAGSSSFFSFARFVSGIAVGSASVVSPAYIAEISPARMRGRLASLQQMGIVVGIFVALLCDEVVAWAAGGVSAKFWWGYEAWRWMFLLEVIPSVAFGVLSLVIPESPRYLVARRREDEARGVIERIQPGEAVAMVEDIRKTVATDRRPRFSDLRGAKGGILPIVWVGIGLSVLQQFVGINVIFYYGATLWEAVGFTSEHSLAINVVTGFVNILSTVVAMVLIDKAGRKPLLLWGSIGMSITLGTVAIIFFSAVTASGTVNLSHTQALLALAAANLYVFSFGVSWGPCVWVLLGEMFRNQIRGAGLAVSAFAQWVANWLITVTFPVILEKMGAGAAYCIYVFFALVSILFVVKMVRETRGMTLEQM